MHLPSDGKKQTKEQVLAEAGISTTSANRYEQLVGRGEKQADQIVNAGEPRVLTATRYGLTAVASVAGIGTSYESPRL